MMRALLSRRHISVSQWQSSYTMALTQGAFDDAIRHSITINIIATKDYRQRVIKLGEQSQRVFAVGGLGDNNIRRLNLLKREKLEAVPNFNLSERIL